MNSKNFKKTTTPYIVAIECLIFGIRFEAKDFVAQVLVFDVESKTQHIFH